MKIVPILHRILVKPDKLEDIDDTVARAKAAGLLIESNEYEREQAAIDTGTVIAMGATVFKDFGADNPLRIGDRVVFAKYGGKAIFDPDSKIKYVALNDEDVIAIVTKEGA
jgi:co-chaperonin GroES (HSP10)